MGYLKRLREEADARGWTSPGDRHVCAACIEEEALSTYIASAADESRCDYCGREEPDKRIAAHIDLLVERIAESLPFEWGDPNEELPYDSGEGGYQGEHIGAEEVLYREECGFASETLMQDVVSALGDREWCQRDYFQLPRHKALIYSWRNFTEVILHKRRYLFLETPIRVWPDIDVGEIEPANMLREIGKVITEVGRIVPCPADSVFLRARAHTRKKVLKGAEQLGPPPDDKAQTNRMSPAGIPMFCGALDKPTVVAEITAVPENARRPLLTIGTFRTAREMLLIDLTNLPSVPSLFDEENRHKRSSIRFLRRFVEDLSKPIRRDGREHVDYVPTQVVAEYFRVAYVTTEGKSAHGLLYPSAHVSGGTNCVLFFERTAYCDISADWAKDPAKWLALETASTEPNPVYGKSK